MPDGRAQSRVSTPLTLPVLRQAKSSFSAGGPAGRKCLELKAGDTVEVLKKKGTSALWCRHMATGSLGKVYEAFLAPVVAPISRPNSPNSIFARLEERGDGVAGPGDEPAFTSPVQFAPATQPGPLVADGMPFPDQELNDLVAKGFVAHERAQSLVQNKVSLGERVLRDFGGGSSSSGEAVIYDD